MRTLKRAVETALDEICEIAENGDPQERLPKEFQLTAAIYRRYREASYRVQLEAGYIETEGGKYGPECDLRIRSHRGAPERWIEVKGLWSAYPLTARISSHVSSILRDIEKLRTMAPRDARKFAVAFLFTGEPARRCSTLRERLRAIQTARLCFEIPERPMKWPESEIASISAMAWQLGPEGSVE